MYVLKNGNLYAYNPTVLWAGNHTDWHSLNTEVDAIAPASGGAVYVLKDGGAFYSYSPVTSWVSLADSVKELAATDRGLYVLREGDKVDFVNPDGSLTNELGFIRDIAVAGGQLYALTTSGAVLHHLGGVNNYRQIGSHGVTTADGNIWYLGTDGVLHILDAALGTITDKVNGFTLSGDIARKWLELGGPAGTLGLPKSSELSIPGGTLIEFEHGAIGHGPKGTFVVRGVVWTRYRNNKRDRGVPTTDEQITETGKRFQRFENGLVFANPLELSPGNYW